MSFQRLGLATAVVAIAVLPACSTWHSMTDRITGRSQGSTATSSSTSTMPSRSPSMGAMPGSSSTSAAMPASGAGYSPSAMRGPPRPGNASMPQFRSYNECRAWLAQLSPAEGKALNRGPMQGGEITMADQDVCRGFPSS